MFKEQQELNAWKKIKNLTGRQIPDHLSHLPGANEQLPLEHLDTYTRQANMYDLWLDKVREENPDDDYGQTRDNLADFLLGLDNN